MNTNQAIQQPSIISLEKEEILVALTQRDLQAISNLLDQKLDQKFKAELTPIYERLDHVDERLEHVDERLNHMDERLEHMDARLDHMDARLDHADDNFKYLDVKLNKTIDKLEALDLSFRNFAQNTKRDIAKLQDGMDTIVEILRINKLVPGNS